MKRSGTFNLEDLKTGLEAMGLPARLIDGRILNQLLRSIASRGYIRFNEGERNWTVINTSEPKFDLRAARGW